MGKRLLVISTNILIVFVISFLSFNCQENINSKPITRKLGKLPDKTFTILTKYKCYSYSLHQKRIELTTSFQQKRHYYLLEYNENHDCIDYQFYYYFDYSNYLIKIRDFNSGEYFKACFIRWKYSNISYKDFSTSDSVYTDINQNEFKLLYPEYKGVIKYEKMDFINIESDLATSITEYNDYLHKIEIKSPSIWSRRAIKFNGEK